jgi:hypothetical protein
MAGRQCRAVKSCAGLDGATDSHASGRLVRRDPRELLDELGAAPVPEAEGEAVATQAIAGAVVDLARSGYAQGVEQATRLFDRHREGAQLIVARRSERRAGDGGEPLAHSPHLVRQLLDCGHGESVRAATDIGEKPDENGNSLWKPAPEWRLWRRGVGW